MILRKALKMGHIHLNQMQIRFCHQSVTLVVNLKQFFKLKSGFFSSDNLLVKSNHLSRKPDELSGHIALPVCADHCSDRTWPSGKDFTRRDNNDDVNDDEFWLQNNNSIRNWRKKVFDIAWRSMFFLHFCILWADLFWTSFVRSLSKKWCCVWWWRLIPTCSTSSRGSCDPGSCHPGPLLGRRWGQARRWPWCGASRRSPTSSRAPSLPSGNTWHT